MSRTTERTKESPARSPRRRKSAPARWLALAALAMALASPEPTVAEGNLFAPVQKLIAGLDLDDARSMLAGASVAAPDDPRIAIERARLAIYEGDCDGAATILARPEVQTLDREQVLGDIARGCQRVTAALVGQRDDERGIDVRWQDENDAPLAPILMETVAAARDALTRDLGVDWPRPTRVIVVRDLLSLAAMTGLPYDNARTTGTVAVAKWGRVTLLSPRANRFGFPWRDTIAHELTHLAVTRATSDRAPLWLQEGVAKREETRWRSPGPFDDRPSPDAIAQHGLERGLGLALDRLGPSIAMLPSADAAMVAFAEVTSFVRFYVESAGPSALPDLFAALKDGKDPNAALLAVSGADLKGWDGRWRAMLESRAKASGSAGPPDPAAQALEAASTPSGTPHDLRDLRDRTRLAELLVDRGHAEGALKELDRMSATGKRLIATDAMSRTLRARALEALGRTGEAAPLVDDPKSIAGDFGPWWALRGRLARAAGDEDRARSSFDQGLAVTPFEPEAACESTDPSVRPGPAAASPTGGGAPSASGDNGKAALCDAARAYALPSFEGE